MSSKNSEMRIFEKNKINTRIIEINAIMKRNVSTIERLDESKDNKEFNKNQIKKLEIKNQEYQKELEKLRKDIQDIDNGVCDKLFEEKLQKNVEINKKKQDIIDKKYVERKEQTRDDSHKLQKFYNSNKTNLSENYLQKEKNRFFKNITTIPDYIVEKLRILPNNKGYIWRNVYCYGDGTRNLRSYYTEIYENFKGGTNIYITDSDFSCVYEKQGKNNRKLISEKSRTK